MPQCHIHKLLKHNVFVERKIKAIKDGFVTLPVPVKKGAKKASDVIDHFTVVCLVA